MIETKVFAIVFLQILLEKFLELKYNSYDNFCLLLLL